MPATPAADRTPVESLRMWLRAASDSQRQRLANSIGTSIPYLYQIAGGHSRIPAPNAAKLVRAAQRMRERSPQLPELVLRREQFAVACSTCEFAKDFPARCTQS